MSNKLGTCPDCGKKVWRKISRCRSCSWKYRIEQGQVNPYSFPPREKHPYWKGGRCKTSSGHISIVYSRDHPRAKKYGRILEHIIVWEKANDKLLPGGWIIHHLNGIPDDNRVSNLVALPKKKHYLVVEAKAKRIQELEGLLRKQKHVV